MCTTTMCGIGPWIAKVVKVVSTKQRGRLKLNMPLKVSHIRSIILSECKTIVAVMQLVRDIDHTIQVITFN